MQKLTPPLILIKRSWEIFTDKNNFKVFIQIYLPLGILSMLSLIQINIEGLSGFFETSPGKTIITIYNLLFLLTSIFVNLAGIMAVIKIANGQSIKVKNIFKSALHRFGPFILFTLVTALIYLLGLILFVIPMFIFAIWFIFGKFIFIEKEFGIKKSLMESRAYVKGKFWKIVSRILVYGLVWLFGQIIFGLLPYGFGTVVMYLCGGFFILPIFLIYKEVSSGSLTIE